MGTAGSWVGASEERTGAHILTVLAAPLNGTILDELSHGPHRLSELRHNVGDPPQTTLRTRLGELSEIRALAKRRLNPFPSIREYELTRPAGRELCFVAAILEDWLSHAPSGPVHLGGEAAERTIKALVDGWSSTMVRALASGSLTLAGLDQRIGNITRSALERRLAAMRLSGLVEAKADEGDEPPHAVTQWLRQGVAPLAAAIRWERRHLPSETAEITPLDAEAGFLLALPLLEMPVELSGSCRLGVEFDGRGDRYLVGVTVEIERGCVTSWTTRLESSPAAWATGPATAWLRTAIEANPNRLELGGNRRLAYALLDSLNRSLFGPARPPRNLAQ